MAVGSEHLSERPGERIQVVDVSPDHFDLNATAAELALDLLEEIPALVPLRELCQQDDGFALHLHDRFDYPVDFESDWSDVNSPRDHGSEQVRGHDCNSVGIVGY